eukprot:7166814-Prymnesium_polylepis.1
MLHCACADCGAGTGIGSDPARPRRNAKCSRPVPSSTAVAVSSVSYIPYGFYYILIAHSAIPAMSHMGRFVRRKTRSRKPLG